MMIRKMIKTGDEIVRRTDQAGGLCYIVLRDLIGQEW